MHAYLDAGEPACMQSFPLHDLLKYSAKCIAGCSISLHLLWPEALHGGCTRSVWEDVPAPIGRTLQQRIVVPFPVEAPLSGVEPNSLPLPSAHVHSGLQQALLSTSLSCCSSISIITLLMGYDWPSSRHRL